MAGKHNELYEHLASEFAATQSHYAKETEFDTIEDKQTQWEERIRNALTELADYCKQCKPVKKKKA